MANIELHIHISKNGNLLLTPERMMLLQLIEESGSLLMASKTIGISYNKAWKMLEAINSASVKLVVEKQRGGNGGGGASLTSFGKALINKYKAVEKSVNEFVINLNQENSFD